jgi:uncharacterized protein YgiM (DUF1202 family)
VLSGNLVFAQDFKKSIESEIEGDGYILIVTKSRTLNVRQKASSLSSVVGSLLNGSQVPFTGITANDSVNLNGLWYQVEYAKGKLGWVSSDYSKKIKALKNEPTPKRVTKLETKSQAPVKEVKPERVAKLESKSQVPVKEVKPERVAKLESKSQAPVKEMKPKRVAKLESKSQAPVKEVKPVAKTNKNNFQNSLRSDDIVKKPAVENKKDSTPVESQGFFKNLFSFKTKKPDKKVSQKAEVKEEKPLANKEEKPWANIDGFRSAKFGMGRAEVTKAIFQDFGIASRNITVIKHPTEGTKSIAITVKDLLPNSGSSRIVYVFGFQSKRLTLVNMLTGHPADASVAPQQVVNSGNYLGNHLLRKRYQDDGLVAHARLSDGSILIFRGKDQKGRMVLLRLSDPQPSNKDNEDLKISLNLSYIEKPEEPDVYKLKEGDF